MDQRRAIGLVVVVGVVVLLVMVGTRWARPPDTDDAGAGLFEGLGGSLGIGRDVRLDEIDTEGCTAEGRDDLSTDEAAVVVAPATPCRVAVERSEAGALDLSDRNRTLVLRTVAGSPTVTFRVQDVVVQDQLGELSEIGVDTDGFELVLSCPLGCSVVIGRPPSS